MANKLKKLVYVDPKNPSIEYEVIVRGAEKALSALKDANGDVIHNTIDAGAKAERYNYVLVNAPENPKYDTTPSFEARISEPVVRMMPKNTIVAEKVALQKTSDKPSLGNTVTPSPVLYKAKESSKPDEKVSLSSLGR